MTTSDVSIHVTACDNEIFLIATQADKSFLLANIKSGNNLSVDYTLQIKPGDFGGVKNVGSPDYPIEDTDTTTLPSGTYSLVVLGVDWGGSLEHFEVALNGGAKPFQSTYGPLHTPAGKGSGWASKNIEKFTIN